MKRIKLVKPNQEGKRRVGRRLDRAEQFEAIAEGAMLVQMRANSWSGSTIDRVVTSDTIERAKASRDAGKFVKRLVYGRYLRNYEGVIFRARQYHYGHSLPWMDGSIRIIPIGLYEKYLSKMRQFQREADEAADELCTNYAHIRDEARKKLGSMFKSDDYPSPDSLREKFGMKVTFNPVPKIGDWRLNLPEEELNRLKAEFEVAQTAQLKEASGSLRRRLFEAMEHLATELAGAKLIKRSLFGKVEKVLDLLPQLNIGGDTDLDRKIAEIRRKLLKTSAQTVREDESVRSKLTKQAKDILDSMSGYGG